MGFQSFPSEKFKCLKCETEPNYYDILQSWTCPECQTPIHIYAEDEFENRHVLNRIPAKELSAGDLVVLPGSGLKFIYQAENAEWSKGHTLCR